MLVDRSVGRDVHVYDAERPLEVLGGLILTNGVTNKNFYEMIEILFLFESSFSLQLEGHRNTVQKDQNPLLRGKYYIHTTSPFSMNNEAWLTRTISMALGTRTKSFRDAVHARDSGCAITGEIALDAQVEDWTGFDCAHIFPLAYAQHWTEHNYNRWITVPPIAGESINSVQNGMLLRSDIHHLFDSYCISINPDDNHKIVCFRTDGKGIAGRKLDQMFLDHPDRPVDSLLRWHFRQAILANMRGAGEPVFETDFPPGSDIAGEIRRGPKAVERMEFELFARLADFDSECSE